jgi:alpha/beta superfamily hydrolase
MPSQVETSVELPDSNAKALLADMGSRVAVIITHPWGPLGGNMHNNVVVAAALYFQKHKISTLRFDFSGSQIGGGHKQVKQVQEASRYLKAALPKPPSYILLVGYSYGSLITASASVDIPNCIGSISIAPPWSVQHWLLLFTASDHLRKSSSSSLPRLFIIGDDDNFTSVMSFQKKIKDIYPPESTTGAVLKDADHFFARREKDIMRVIGEWLLETYPLQAEGSVATFGRAEFYTAPFIAEAMARPAKKNAAGRDVPLDCGAALGLSSP